MNNNELVLTAAMNLMEDKLKELMGLNEYMAFIEEVAKQAFAVAEEEMRNALMEELKNIAENNIHDQTGIYRNV